MTRDDSGTEVAVSNRQCRLKVNTRLLSRIVRRALDLVHDADSQLGIVLVDDAAIAKLNAQYHATPGPTDVLSFNYGEGQGELIISAECAIRQAKRFRTTPGRELALYVVHGILHLHGYDDQASNDRRHMRATERRLMSQMGEHFKFKDLISKRLAKR